MSARDPLNILLFNTAHRWIGEAAGTDLLAREMARRGHRVTVIVPTRSIVHENVRDGRPYKVVPVPWRMPRGKGSKRPRMYRKVWRVLRKVRPDIIQLGRGEEHWCAAALRPLACPHGRIVRTRHVVLPLRENLTNRLLFRLGTDAVTAISQAAFRGLGKLGCHLPDSRRCVVYGAVNMERYAASRRSRRLREELGAGGDRLLVGCLGRLQSIKGYDLFLEGFARAAVGVPGLRGVLAGRRVRPDHHKIEPLHAKWELEGRMSYLGMVDEPEQLVASLDVGVIASRGSEGFSRIAVEYMASGVPVVATRVGALPEILRDGETGLLVPADDAGAIAEAIRRLIDDPALRRRLVQNAMRDVHERFAPDRYASEMERVYHEVLRSGRG